MQLGPPFEEERLILTSVVSKQSSQETPYCSTLYGWFKEGVRPGEARELVRVWVMGSGSKTLVRGEHWSK